MKRILIVGQAPPAKIVELPFGASALYKWFAEVGIIYKKDQDFEFRHNQEGFFLINEQKVARVKFAALINYFPGNNKSGGHLAPTPKQIFEDRPILLEIIDEFNPDIIISIGKLSTQEALKGLNFPQPGNIKLDEVIGKNFEAKAYGSKKKVTVIPFPHPSGASTWIYQQGNRELLQKALNSLKNILKS